MVKNIKQKHIAYSVIFICFIILLFRCNSYLLTDYLSEAPFVASAFESKGFFAAFMPTLNGDTFLHAGPLYYLMQSLSAKLFGNFSELSARFFSCFISVLTALMSYLAIKKAVNVRLARIASLSLVSVALFVIYSAVSSPNMLASCFMMLSILSLITGLLDDENQNKKTLYVLFWILSAFSIFTGGVMYFVLSFIIAVPVVLCCKKASEFIKKSFLGVLLFILSFILYLYIFYRHGSVGFLKYFVLNFRPAILTVDMSNNYLYYLKYFAMAFVIGFLPWVFSFVSIALSFAAKFLKEIFVFRTDLKSVEFDLGRKFFLISVWGFICSLFAYFVFSINNFTGLIPASFFAAMAISYYWYRNIYFKVHKKAITLSAIAFYLLLISLALFLVISYFFVSSVFKTYIESLIIPVILITLLVAIPGMLSIMLKRRLLNFSIHILFSFLLYFVLTGLFFNYICSFGENDLVNFSLKAKEDKVMLVTFDLKNKYSMTYYYGAPIVFNGTLSAEEIYNNYGDSREIYLVLRHTDLAYFDKFFVYEIVASGKQYCEITNIKYLPTDEVKENPEITPDLAD